MNCNHEWERILKPLEPTRIQLSKSIFVAPDIIGNEEEIHSYLRCKKCKKENDNESIN